MNEAQRDAWLAEMWPVCREVPREERDVARQAEWEARVLFEMNTQAANDSAVTPVTEAA